MYDYIKYVDSVIKNSDNDLEVLRREHLIKINFFQHERLIHLLVTLLVMFLGFGFLFVVFLIAGLI
ncbi:MAG: hypothetical protein J6B89_00535 [Bacilli bacterium]|nr:hypothetical protein [Bacilli bacterium]